MSGNNRESVAAIASSFGNKPELLVQILQTVVQQQGWISAATVRQLADTLNLSRADVHGVVEYYHDFRTEPPGKYIIKICRAEACQAMGSRQLVDHAHSTVESDTTLEAVYCLGNCACAPAVMINGKTHGRVDSQRFDDLVSAMRKVNP